MCPDNVLKALEKKQDAMQKLLMEDQDRQRKMADDLQAAVQMQHELKVQPEAKIQAPKEKKKLFPDSALFKEWGENLSQEEQREAEALFKKYGYNVFLSDRLPLDRPLADTREPRYNSSSIYTPAACVCSRYFGTKDAAFVLCFEQVLGEDLPKGPAHPERGVDLPERGLVHHQTSPAKHHQPHP